MSWIDRLNNIVLTVTTGEGSTFTPLFKNASRSRNMNASKFNFNNVQGSLVKRGEAESMAYPFEFHFTGEDHIDESERFNQASLDNRPWRLTHPNYGDVVVQPITLNFNDNNQNDTVVTGELFETIEDSFADSDIDVREDVLKAVENSIDAQVEAFNIEQPSAVLVNTSTEVVENNAELNKARAITDIDLATVQNASNAAINSINNLTNDPVTFMRRTAELARTPSKFYSRIQDRITVLNEAYTELKTSIGLNSSNQEKLLFETTGGVIVSAIAEASIIETQEIADEQFIEDNTIVDYQTRSDVIAVIDAIKQILQDYLDTLGTLQSEIDATPDSYTPQQNSINNAKTAVNKATGQLLQIAIQTRQERRYTVPQEVALLILVHRLLGTYDSATVESFAENNQINLDEWLQIPQGRELIYYI